MGRSWLAPRGERGRSAGVGEYRLSPGVLPLLVAGVARAEGRLEGCIVRMDFDTANADQFYVCSRCIQSQHSDRGGRAI